MQQLSLDCQLSSAERRVLAEAEIAAQKRLLTALMAEFREAVRRIRKARRILAEVE